MGAGKNDGDCKTTSSCKNFEVRDLDVPSPTYAVDSVFGRLWPSHMQWNLGVGHKCLIGGNVGVEYPDFNLPTPN